MVRVFPIFFKKKCGILFVAISVYSGCYFLVTSLYKFSLQTLDMQSSSPPKKNALC